MFGLFALYELMAAGDWGGDGFLDAGDSEGQFPAGGDFSSLGGTPESLHSELDDHRACQPPNELWDEDASEPKTHAGDSVEVPPGIEEGVCGQGHDHDLMRPEMFQKNGTYDPVHGCRVEGRVAADILLVDQQTTSSCSLMAQEQFVQRYHGHSVAESELIDIAWRDGVYSWWGGGTTFAGLDSILDHYDVPHRRLTTADVPRLERFLGNGCDALVCVDASVLYNDPSIGPDAGHAVAVVGRGISSWTGRTAGFYITDSNYPGTTRFVTVEQFESCWSGDIIAVPATRATDPRVLFA